MHTGTPPRCVCQISKKVLYDSLGSASEGLIVEYRINKPLVQGAPVGHLPAEGHVIRYPSRAAEIAAYLGNGPEISKQLRKGLCLGVLHCQDCRHRGIALSPDVKMPLLGCLL